MEHKLSHQQKFLHKMALTPQMRQSLNILSMPVNDLAEFIDTAITKNPFLQKIIERKSADKYKKGTPAAGDDSSSSYQDSLKQEENPRVSLLSQIKMMGLEDSALEIAEYLIFEMDDNGYITADPEDVAAELDVMTEDVRECLAVIQAMEPAGIGARDVSECLQLQLKRKGMESYLEYAVVSSFLTEVARGDIAKIAKALDVSRERVRSAVDNIKKLNPKPASSVLSKEVETVIPELIAKVGSDKVWLELNRGVLPGLKLYNPYESNFDILKDPEARKFMKENMNAAKTLIDNLKRREDTVCKVANYILDVQRDSLTEDKQDIKSLTIKDVAKAVNFHPSTISRAVSNKYIQVNDKVIPLNSLLSHGIKNENGELQSKTAIKTRIEALVKAEDPGSPMTDSEICEKLKDEGVILSRRTVAKYRKYMRILPTYLRKKVKPSI